MLPALGTALGIALLVGGPWLARNQVLYGDPLALGAFSKAANAIGPGYAEFSPLLDIFAYTRAVLWTIFLTAWGFFGGPNSAIKATDPLGLGRIPGPRVPQLWLAPLMLVCLAAPLLMLLGLRRGAAADAPRDAIETGEAAINTQAKPGAVPFWILGIILVLLAWAQFVFSHFAGAQARYLHPALLPFCVFFALGWTRLFEGRAFKVAAILLGATLLILTLLNLLLWKTLV